MSRSGLAILLKPAGMTSFEVVSWVRRRVGERRVGHAGTLDPAAAGVMVVAVGPAARWLSFLDDNKAYVGEVVFGRATTTADATGETLAEEPSGVTEAGLRALLPAFVGTIRQRPPAVSAVRIDGRRAHERVRAGEDVVVPEREVRIDALELLAFDAERQAARLAIACSAGTYIRSLAEDLGRALGVPAHLAFLVRTRSGPWGLQVAQPLDETLELRLQAVDDGLRHWPRLDLDDVAARAFRLGQGVSLPEAIEPAPMVAVWHQGCFIGLGRPEGDRLRPERTVSQA
ncbi:MAG: tRNA pseudouridine(55) synthase TruB [Candidatus Sericytochromatia bacterium]|nr:tRNA pseudouridine(55) synthase TruB [Candidatus Sericytochromatia bacterium]